MLSNAKLPLNFSLKTPNPNPQKFWLEQELIPGGPGSPFGNNSWHTEKSSHPLFFPNADSYVCLRRYHNRHALCMQY